MQEKKTKKWYHPGNQSKIINRIEYNLTHLFNSAKLCLLFVRITLCLLTSIDLQTTITNI